MSPAAWGVIGAVIGPLLVFVTFLASRHQEGQKTEADIMQATVASALSTTETMRLLLQPLEEEISTLRREASEAQVARARENAEMRQEIKLLRQHITALEGHIRTLGGTPPEPPFPLT